MMFIEGLINSLLQKFRVANKTLFFIALFIFGAAQFLMGYIAQYDIFTLPDNWEEITRWVTFILAAFTTVASDGEKTVDEVQRKPENRF